jgi:hypothetical protein
MIGGGVTIWMLFLWALGRKGRGPSDTASRAQPTSPHWPVRRRYWLKR